MKLVPVTNTFAKVDDEDYEKVVARGMWSLVEWRGKQYAKRKVRVDDEPYPEYSTESMHWFITGWDYVDHIDGDGLNNQRSNLRQATHKQNIQSQKPQSRPKSSAYRGVCWFKPKAMWRARLKVDGREVHIGYFLSEVDAARAWDREARRQYGEFAYQNLSTH